jgi:hypothetical protein
VRVIGSAAGIVALLAIAGCGSAGGKAAGDIAATTGSPAPTAAQIVAYVRAVEQVRLPVNTLLGRADPILAARHDHRISATAASARMDALEHRFASYTLTMQLIHPSNPALLAINAPYAATYLDEDSYLATLSADLVDGDFDNLPDTQAAQRLAIVTWRTGLEVVARRAGVPLPADLQQAGRGEIAPSPDGS